MTRPEDSTDQKAQYRVPRGTSDLLPETAEVWHFLEETARTVFEGAGYQPIETPMFEHTALFSRGIGEGTDIVRKEMYTFSDRAGRSLTLRPEGTAPVVRAYCEHKMYGGPQPVKLYYWGSMFRYERPQAGRSRQFWQTGIEVMGAAGSMVDAEVIVLLMQYLRAIGLTDLHLELNSMGCPNDRPGYVDALRMAMVGKAGFCEDCVRRIEENPLRVFDCKEPGCVSLVADAPKITDHLDPECRRHFEEVKNYLGAAGERFALKPTLVRGFDYYTRTAFEVTSPHLGAQSALGGGGRYDGLVEMFGGPQTPGIGFAIGIERVAMALAKEGVALPAAGGIEVLVVIVSDGERLEAFKLLNRLRKAGVACDADFLGRSVKTQMKGADRRGASVTVILGPEELARGRAVVRTMGSGEEKEVALDDVVSGVKAELDGLET